MPVYRLTHRVSFPSPELAEAGGLLAVGGDLRPERLVLGYRMGIFPWYSEGEPIWWHSPDPRFVLLPEKLHIPRSLRKIIRRGDFEVRLDSAFPEVIRRCAGRSRPNQKGTWITRDMVAAYEKLWELGIVHSAEAWQNGKLVGGLYGCSLGDMYFGESMFADVPDASKVAFVVLVRWMQAHGIRLIDSQVHTEHVERFGGEEWPREDYLTHLAMLVDQPTRIGRWKIEADDPALDV